MSETDEGAGAQRPEVPEPALDGSFWKEYLESATPIEPAEPEQPQGETQAVEDGPVSVPTYDQDNTLVMRVPSAYLGAAVPASARRGRRGATAVTAIACGAVAGAGTWLGLGILDKEPGLTSTDLLNEWDQAGNTTNEEADAPWTVAWDATYVPELEPYSPGHLNAPNVFDDGLDHANLPPLVPRTSLTYPEAHEITDQIWAAAGPGWMLASYGDAEPCGIPIPGESGADPALDLVSPEGVHFRLPLPIGATDSYGGTPGFYTINHANLSEGWAIVTTGTFFCYEGGGGNTAVWFDLRTGEVFSSVPTDSEYSDASGALDAVGPLAGGSEVRLRHHRDSDPEEGDGLFVWTPEEGEVAVEIPEGIALGDLSILGIADATAGLVVLETPKSWTQDWENSAIASRLYVLDARTGDLREVFPAVPGGANWVSFAGLTPTALIENTSLTDSDGRYRSAIFLAPLDGSAPSEIAMEESYRLLFEPIHLVPVIECQDDSCNIVAVNDTSGSNVLEPRDDYPYYSAMGINSTSWGGGILSVWWDRYGQAFVVNYDPGSGARFEPFPIWVPDTGAYSGLKSVFVFPSTPEER